MITLKRSILMLLTLVCIVVFSGCAIFQYEWKVEARHGDLHAQNKLGHGYFSGSGFFPQDYQESLKWFRMAAEQGDKSAQNQIGTMYYNGQGVTRDYQEALKWFRMAAAQGDTYARNNLNLPEMVMAAHQFAENARRGDPIAQNDMGYIYYYGIGVPQNYQEALKWFRLAAAQGQPVARNNLNLPEMVKAAQQSEPSISLSQNPVESRPDNNIDTAKSKCVDLGFKKNTEAFGSCVLKLSK